MKPTRREILKAGITAGLAAQGATLFANSGDNQPTHSKTYEPKAMKFKLKYAPHFGMFQNSAGPDPIDQLKFAADEGFTAWEDNGMKGRSPAEQEKIGKAMHDLGISMGIFVVNPDTAWTPFLATGAKEPIDKFVKECKDAIDVCKRTNAKWMTFVPGAEDSRLDRGYQLANAIDGIRRGCEVLEPHGYVMVLEALNRRRDHPGMLINMAADNFLLMRAVNSPSLKMLFDLYHQAIDDGNLIPHIDHCWNEIAYFQTGDHPGRCEPGTGEVNYLNVFKHIHSKNFTGIVGMEHGNSKSGKEGERAVIDAYRACDSF